MSLNCRKTLIWYGAMHIIVICAVYKCLYLQYFRNIQMKAIEKEMVEEEIPSMIPLRQKLDDELVSCNN